MSKPQKERISFYFHPSIIQVRFVSFREGEFQVMIIVCSWSYPQVGTWASSTGINLPTRRSQGPLQSFFFAIGNQKHIAGHDMAEKVFSDPQNGPATEDEQNCSWLWYHTKVLINRNHIPSPGMCARCWAKAVAWDQDYHTIGGYVFCVPVQLSQTGTHIFGAMAISCSSSFVDQWLQVLDRI